MPSYQKDPEAVLDWQFDWTSWLADAETIATHTVTAEDGLTVDSSAEADGVVTVWVSGGTAGTRYRLECLISTSAGRTDERSVSISVRER